MAISTDERLMIQCLSRSDPAEKNRELSVYTGQDWMRLFRPSKQNSCLPLIYHKIRKLEMFNQLPEEIKHRFREKYYLTLKSNVRLFSALQSLIKMSNRKEIPVLLLKGAHLAELVYGNIALRPMIDIDLLVKREDTGKMEEALAEMGFEAQGNIGRLKRDVEREITKELPLYINGNHIRFDIHWTLEKPHYPFSIDVDGLWDRSGETGINGSSVRILSPEDLLLHLCVHLAYHDKFSAGLRPLCDVAEILHFYKDVLDWEVVIARAESWNAGRSLYLTLLLVKRLLGFDDKNNVLESLLPDDFDEGIFETAKDEVFEDRAKDPRLSPNLTLLWSSQPLPARLKRYMRSIFPTRRKLARIYQVSPHSPRVYFYYLVRIKDLFHRYGFVNSVTHYAKGSWYMLKNRKDRMILSKKEKRWSRIREWLGGTEM